MANLMESYKNRLAIAEKYFAQQTGDKLSNQRKMVTAMCLDNTARFMNEAFANSVGTQRSDLGKFKVFALDITTLAIPNLIVNEIFMVVPMSSFTGYLTYMEYALGTEKGGAGGERDARDDFKNAMETYQEDNWAANDIIASPFKGFGKMTAEREAYSGERVVETLKAGEEISWTPVLPGTQVMFSTDGGTTWSELAADSEGKYVAASDGKAKYVYDNQYIPQKNLPTVVGRMHGIALTARARRLAVYYSQIAAFQSKNDYGMDFESTISQQAQAELQYEIDAEAVFMVKAEADKIAADDARLVKWVDEELDTISYSMKAEGFARKIEQAKAAIYKVTGRFMPNWMLVGPEVMPILTFVPGFNASNASVANGPYVAGTVNGLKVVVSPMLGKECILGVLGADGKTATGVFAPYMPIVPTQLLGFADGTMSQGFSTLYDMKILNASLIAKIEITTGNNMFLGQVQVIQPSSEV